MRDIFCDHYVIVNFDQLHGEMELKEDETGQSIKIRGIPDNAILLKLDVNRREYKVRSFYLRAGLEYIHKGCDYCLIIPDQSLAVLFELKSKNPKGYIDQFIVSELFISYCLSLWNNFSCSKQTLTFKRVLLSPKFNNAFTSPKGVFSLTNPDRCKKEVRFVSPGFPHNIRLEKLI